MRPVGRKGSPPPLPFICDKDLLSLFGRRKEGRGDLATYGYVERSLCLPLPSLLL